MTRDELYSALESAALLKRFREAKIGDRGVVFLSDGNIRWEKCRREECGFSVPDIIEDEYANFKEVHKPEEP